MTDLSSAIDDVVNALADYVASEGVIDSTEVVPYLESHGLSTAGDGGKK
jgi:hypothetical protein